MIRSDDNLEPCKEIKSKNMAKWPDGIEATDF